MQLTFKTFYKILLFLILQSAFCSLRSFAQTYPVQLTTNLVPPYSGYLPDYADPSSEKLKVILQFNDFTVPHYNVKLKFEIKGNGFTLTTKQFYNPPPLQIEPGVPYMLSGADIAPYINSANLDFVGINQSQYEQRMALPEGYYSICVKAYDYYNGGNVQVSNESCAQAWFTLSDPPFLNLPMCNAAVVPQTPQNILFQWTPMNLGSPNSALNTEYLFELWECRPDSNANPNQIAQSTPPIFSTTTQQALLNYGLTEPPLNLYMKYVWRVKAQDVSGRDLFKNNGYSQICTFNYGSVANVLGNALTLNLSAQAVTHRMGKCTWNTQNLFTSYKLQVRKQGTANWFDYNTTQGSEKVTNLEPNTDYEAQVQGIGNGVTSAWSNIATFRTNNEPSYNCNDQTQLADPLQAQPLPINKAIAGLIIQTGQFEVLTTQIAPTGAPGWYSGKGYARVFGLLPLAVKWDNIYIDDNNRHQQGVIQAMTKGVDNWLHQWDVNQATENATYVNGTITSFTVNNGQYCYTLQGSNQQLCDSLPGGTNVFIVRDGSGNEYTVQLQPPPPTVTGPTNYLQTSTDDLAACDSLQINFEASSTQNFGFDKKEYAANIPSYECIKLSNGQNYFVPFKSIGEGQTDEVIANIQIQNFNANNLSFKTQSGTALTSTSITTTQYKITGIPATAISIYAWYNNKKIAKLNVVSLKSIIKKLVVVPVNGSTNSVTAAQLNGIYKQANVSWSVTTASDFTFSLGNDGLEAADATLLSKYSTEMRALRDAYKQATPNYDKDAYYIFVVPNFSNAQLKGYMVRGRALGFVTSNANAKELAHELAHGAFGLEHTFPKIAESTTNNLLDYANGSQLTKTQWDEMQNPNLLPSWNDSEEDASLTTSNTANLQTFLSWSFTGSPLFKDVAKAFAGYLVKAGFTQIVPVNFQNDKATVNAIIAFDGIDLNIEKVFYESDNYNDHINFLLDWGLDLNQAEIAANPDWQKRWYFRLKSWDDYAAGENPPAPIELVARVAMGVPGALYGWYTGKDWMYNTELSKLDHALNLLEVVPIALVTKLGTKAIKSIKVAGRVLDISKDVNKAKSEIKLLMVKNIYKTIDDFWAKVIGNVNEIKAAFIPNTAELKYTTQDLYLYRHCSNGAPQLSNWYTDVILSPSQARIKLALPNSNTAQRVIKVKIPAGTAYVEGGVASQVNKQGFGSYATGGGKQFYFLDGDKAFFQVIEDIANP